MLWEQQQQLIIAEYLAKDTQFKGMALKQSETYLGQISVLEGLTNDLKSSYGEGYMEERTMGMQNQSAFLSGTAIKDMQEANRLIGQWKASLENDKERMEREILSAVINGNGLVSGGIGPSKDYSSEQIKRVDDLANQYRIALAEENGAEAGRILAQAQIEAQATYNASEGAQQLVAMQQSLIEQTSKTLAADKNTYLGGYRVGEAYSSGIMAAIKDSNPYGQISPGAGSRLDAHNASSPSERQMSPIGQGFGSRAYWYEQSKAPGNAWGIPYVPRDDYITRLHEGERVLTASEARAQDRGKAPNININTPSIVIREEADLRKIAQGLATELYKAHLINK